MSTSEIKQGTITDPKDKLIQNDEAAFRKHLTKTIKRVTFAYRLNPAEAFRHALEGQQRLGNLYVNAFRKSEPEPYTKHFLHRPWPLAGKYEKLHKLFLYQPLFVEPFLTKIDQFFYLPVLKAWRETQSISYFPKTSDYLA